MTATLIALVALVLLLATQPKPPGRHTGPRRRTPLHLAEAPGYEQFTWNDQEWIVVKDETRVRVVSLAAVREEQLT